MQEMENPTDTTASAQTEQDPQTKAEPRQVAAFIAFLVSAMVLALSNAAAVYHVEAVYVVFGAAVACFVSLFFTLRP